MKRKDFIKNSLFAGVGLSMPISIFSSVKSNWDAGYVKHILPTVNHNRILITLSLSKSFKDTPVVKIGSQKVKGIQRDSHGEYWIFDIQNLESNTAYKLKLTAKGSRLCDDWTIKTFPHPNAEPERLRLLVYTCAGGHPLSRDLLPIFKETREQFVNRRLALLKRGMSFAPDAVIAIGDQVYWDLAEILPGIPGEGDNEMAFREAGKFDEKLPILGSSNEMVLKKAIDPQIAELYGTMCRSTPVFMVNDDHDYFANDKATSKEVTFPPSYFNLKLARAVQGMYWPEFLPDPNRPLGLSGSNAPDKVKQSSESYGTLRYGRLAEMLIYDCRRFTTLHGPSARFIAKDAEKWLMERTTSKDTLHTIHIPSLPIGWSAGKWMEWYPDKRDKAGNLTKKIEKYFWQQGWQNQHDRILSNASTQKHKKPIFLQGDLHTFASGKIYRSRALDFEKNPIHANIVGSLGSTAFPSAARGVKASIPTDLGMEELFENVEESGFSIVDITEDFVEIKMYKFLGGRDDLSIIEHLEPFQKIKIKR